jgi:structural maintenance of chromosome 4
LHCAGAPRLFDLVDTKDELRPAFYNALGNTVVARNIDHASEIAYAPKSQLRKVVTLKVRSASPPLRGHLT